MVEVDVPEELYAALRHAGLSDRDVVCVVLLATLLANEGRPNQGETAEIQRRLRLALGPQSGSSTAKKVVATIQDALIEDIPATLDLSGFEATPSLRERLTAFFNDQLVARLERGVNGLLQKPAFRRTHVNMGQLSIWDKILVLLAHEKARKEVKRRRRPRKGRK